MSHRNIIVIGCSLGGVEALPRLIGGLAALDAAIFVVMHLMPGGRNPLVTLIRSSALEVRAASDGEPIKPGTIYLAVPDRHLLIEGDRVRLARGPKESHARPSIDALFRSAAFAAGPRVIGIVLTGTLDDGTAGLWSIKDRGGVAIVQCPEEAPYPSMPRSALANVQIDHVLRLEEMPGCLLRLTKETLSSEGEVMRDESLKAEVGIALGQNALEQGVRALGEPSFFSCPECRGSMVLIREGPIQRFRCHTGHGFSTETLAHDGLAGVERKLWSALAQLEEHYVLLQEAQPIERAQEVSHLLQRLRELAQDPLFRPAD
jgi:two-component system, chemotaxis family, protein-glutamate methylesterase/glutaminase